jgi:hypothetical protein
MTLSDERQRFVKMQIERYCSEHSVRQTAELKQLYYSLSRRAQWKSV